MDQLLEKPPLARDMPLAIVAEDNVVIRQNAVTRLERRGIRALAAASLEEAENILRGLGDDWPDVAVLDIHLDADNRYSGDMSGLTLARMLRERARPIQIVGYSGKFDEGSIDTSDLDLFDHIARKGQLSREEHERLWDVCARYAHEGWRIMIMGQLDALRRELEREEPASEILERLERDQVEGGRLELAGPLQEAGFRLEPVRLEAGPSSRSYRTTVVWIQHDDSDEGGPVNVEVYGQPSLYASGASEHDALRALAEYICALDLQLEADRGLSHHSDLRSFLDSLFL